MITRDHDFKAELDQTRNLLGPVGLASDAHWLPFVFILLAVNGLKNREIVDRYVKLNSRTFHAKDFVREVGWQLSSGESFMMQLALHLWNSQFKLDEGLEMLAGLDNRNYEIATLAIHLRYRGYRGTTYEPYKPAG